MYNAKNYIHGQGRQDEEKARGQTFLKGTDKLLTVLKSLPAWSLEGQLHSS